MEYVLLYFWFKVGLATTIERGINKLEPVKS